MRLLPEAHMSRMEVHILIKYFLILMFILCHPSLFRGVNYLVTMISFFGGGVNKQLYIHRDCTVRETHTPRFCGRRKVLKQRWGEDVDSIPVNNSYSIIPVWDLKCSFVIDDDIVWFIWV